ncbi:MAG TPA: FtsX-like permease family protein [Terriglobia bacterium]|jgi:putative ABC transport system permease protein
MRIAWRNLAHDKVRFIVTIIGVAFSVFLTIFQGSLLAGFIRAASKNIDATDGDIWLTARGLNCFEFATSLPSRYVEISRGIPGVHEARRIVAGYANWRKPSGSSQLVFLIGADAGIGHDFPLPLLHSARPAISPETVTIDATDAKLLEVSSLPADLEINNLRATVAKAADGFGSFFGAPYVYTGYADAARYLQVPPENVSFIVLRISPRNSPSVVKRELQRRLPDIDVWTREEFSAHSQTFWVLQTGAGGAILVAAILGFVVGFVVVSQNMYAMTMEKLEEFATLKALGASPWYVRRIVLQQALISGFAGSLIGVLLTLPGVAATQRTISWIYMPWWLPYAMGSTGLLMSALASLAALRRALSIDPARVFRA